MSTLRARKNRRKNARYYRPRRSPLCTCGRRDYVCRFIHLFLAPCAIASRAPVDTCSRRRKLATLSPNAARYAYLESELVALKLIAYHRPTDRRSANCHLRRPSLRAADTRVFYCLWKRSLSEKSSSATFVVSCASCAAIVVFASVIFLYEKL